MPFPTLGDLSDPGIEYMFPALAGRFFATVPPGKLDFYPNVTYFQSPVSLPDFLSFPNFLYLSALELRAHPSSLFIFTPWIMTFNLMALAVNYYIQTG